MRTVNEHARTMLEKFVSQYALLQVTNGAKATLDHSGTYTAGQWAASQLEGTYRAACELLGQEEGKSIFDACDPSACDSAISLGHARIL